MPNVTCNCHNRQFRSSAQPLKCQRHSEVHAVVQASDPEKLLTKYSESSTLSAWRLKALLSTELWKLHTQPNKWDSHTNTKLRLIEKLCVCVCVCVTERERERERQRERDTPNIFLHQFMQNKRSSPTRIPVKISQFKLLSVRLSKADALCHYQLSHV
jgi:hypothetical protein